MEKVPQAGYEIKGLWISGIQRKLSLKNVLFPLKLVCSVMKAYSLIQKFKPDVVIGTGGFASGPVAFVASKKKIPTLIQEQNSLPGITNKLLANKVDKICVAYDGLERFFPKDKLVKTGNPVRQDLLDVASKRAVAQETFKLNPNKKTLLVIGGSLGARALNQLMAKNIDWLLQQNVQVIWQIGKLYVDDYQKYSELEGVQTHAFLNEMDKVYAAADFIISRAGAIAISELSIVGKPTIFIPSPNVAEDHQTKNAQAIVSKNAALMLKETELDSFQMVFSDLLNDENNQQQLAENLQALALPGATEMIVGEVEKLLGF